MDDKAGSWSMVSTLKRFAQNESGATAIEYGLIASLIAVALIAGASLLGNNLGNTFNGVAGKLKTPT
jgi:pilus assembly protein Flp/PilA